VTPLPFLQLSTVTLYEDPSLFPCMYIVWRMERGCSQVNKSFLILINKPRKLGFKVVVSKLFIFFVHVMFKAFST